MTGAFDRGGVSAQRSDQAGREGILAELVRVVALLLPLGIEHVARDVVAVDRNHPLGCARHRGLRRAEPGDGDLFGGLVAQLVPFEGILKVEELDRLVVRRPRGLLHQTPDEGDDGVVGEVHSRVAHRHPRTLLVAAEDA